jgi:hypothetical protein
MKRIIFAIILSFGIAAVANADNPNVIDVPGVQQIPPNKAQELISLFLQQMGKSNVTVNTYTALVPKTIWGDNFFVAKYQAVFPPYGLQEIAFFMISTGNDFQVTATSRFYTLPEETFRQYLDTGDKSLFPEVLDQNADPTE